MEFNSNQKNNSILKRIDIFGIGINIKFNQNEKHTTGLGGFITLVVYFILIWFLISLIEQITIKDKPFVLSEKQYVEIPQKYDLKENNFQIVFALLNSKNVPFIDPEIYEIQLQFYVKEVVISENGQNNVVSTTKALNISPCKESYFQDTQTKKYFTELTYESMYCIDDPTEIYLQGQFDAQIFSRLQVQYKECNKSIRNCKPPEIVKQALATSIVQIYFTTNILQIQNQQNPFKRVGYTQFWISSYDIKQVASVMFMNCNIKDDVGLFLEDNQYQRDLMFSSDRLQYSTRVDSSFFEARFSLEKNLESFYSRSYLKIPQAVSQVGGIFNVLFAVGCLLSRPYQKMQFHRQLINSTFSFERNSNKENLSQLQKQDTHKFEAQKSLDPINSPNQSKTLAFIENSKGMTPHPQDISCKNDNNQSEKKIIQDEVFQNESEENCNGQFGLTKMKQIFQEIKITTSDYILSYFNYFKCQKSQQKELLQFCVSKIYRYTDICFIVNKLIELEKLKNLLLDNDQIKLFEYIPKPKVDYDLLQQNNLNKINEKDIILKSDQLEDENLKQNEQLNDQIVNILSIENRPLSVKAKQAQVAFNKIQQKQSTQSEIDKKLIMMLDRRLRFLLETNRFQQNIEAHLAHQRLKKNLFKKNTLKSSKSQRFITSMKSIDNNKHDETPFHSILNIETFKKTTSPKQYLEQCSIDSKQLDNLYDEQIKTPQVNQSSSCQNILGVIKQQNSKYFISTQQQTLQSFHK